VTDTTIDATRWLASADELAAARRRLEAIDLLSEANRHHRDAELERRLVRLRHEAFDEIDRSPSPVSWSERTAHDGSSGPAPILPPSDLTPELIRRSLLEYGYVHVRGLVPQAHVDRLVEGIDRALASAAAFEAGTDASETTPWFEPFAPAKWYPTLMKRQVGNRRKWVRESGGVWTADSPRMLFEFFETIDEVGLARLLNAYFGERPALAVDKCTLRRVGIDTSTDWHQDGAFLGTDIRTLNVWLALSDCGRDAPGLDIVPTRLDRIVETGTEGAKFSWAVGPGVVERLGTTTPVVRPIFEPGDALLFDEMFLHRTAIDEGMTRARYAIETWFFAPSVYPEKYVPVVA
jgi:hypothetical protein